MAVEDTTVETSSGGDDPVWLIRAGQQGRAEELAVSEGVAIVGWSELGPLTPEMSRDEIKAMISTAYGEQSASSLSGQASSPYRFIHEVAVGDLVVLPLLTHPRHVAIGRITGPYVHRPDKRFFDLDAVNTRSVNWIAREVAYERFDPDLQEAFGQQGTLRKIGKPSAAARILSSLAAPPELIHLVGETGSTTRVWWVCQGATRGATSDLGVLWAPKIAKDGTSRRFWRALEDARAGDIVLHYADSHIRGVSTVTEEAVEAPNPAGPSDNWQEGDGWLVNVDYRELDEAIPLASIPIEWRIAEQDPFTKDGGVRQGYFSALSDRFAGQLAGRFPQLVVRL